MKLIEDCQYDVVELELKKAGARLENKLNQEVITSMLRYINGPTDVDGAGTHLALSDIGLAKANVDAYGWMADTVFLHPNVYGYIIDETNLGAITSGDNKTIGLNTYIVDVITDGTSPQYWDGVDATNHYGGLVFDAYNFAVITMREDINFKQTEDPIHDLENLIVKMRFGVGILNKDAGCRILTK